MNVQSETLPYDPASFDHAAYHGFRPAPGLTRHEGWTPDKQRLFLESLSEGRTVVQACAIVGLSKQSAYALRQSPRGQGFALGWEAAVLLARNALADELMERALRGVHERVTQADGGVVLRHRQDNRLAMAMLNRLDRIADSAKGPGTAAAARLIATDFAQYLDLVGRDAGPARAGVFLGARVEPAAADDLAPIRALARADRWLRTHTDVAEPLDTADLDPAARGEWTGEQWIRAEAAGLVELAPETPPASQASQADAPIDHDNPGDAPVWWCNVFDRWVTRFPPPDDFDGEEEGEYGDADYSRTLTFEEIDQVETPHRIDTEARRLVESAARDRWFALHADAAGDGDGPEDAAGGAPEAGTGPEHRPR